ncbi:MAG: pyridoxal-phosphate dependent enzyme [Ignavibacteriae bacterium]|nr:pyridoxal-phosphate dependent enzyme [Ignavibacteriota bacterium]
MKEPQKLNLANIPTPVQKISFEGCEFLIKRDDLTGVELTGNKVRKLEYLLHDAIKRKCEYVFTSGGDQSNHARATTIAATSLGFKTKLFLWGNKNQNADGNLYLDKLTGAEIIFLTRKEYDNVNLLMNAEMEKLQSKGINSYVIPSGGSSTLGIWGYINFVKELSNQINFKNVKGILLANGSSGTTAGILVGCALLGVNLKIFPVNVLQTKEEVFNEIETLVEGCIKDFKLPIKVNYQNIEILDGYSTEGYKNITKDKIDLINGFFRQTGILLDPTYTGKAFKAYHENFIGNKNKTNVMFLHTGGIFGAFAKKKNYLS